MRQLFRGMRPDGDKPLIDRSARALGVRVGTDIVLDSEGNVAPGQGMSVAPDDPLLLPPHRRPSEFGGTGTDPVWRLADNELGDSLSWSQDAPTHGVIEAAHIMSLAEYEDGLADTQDRWVILCHPS
jgi:hypothetical protein